MVNGRSTLFCVAVFFGLLTLSGCVTPADPDAGSRHIVIVAGAKSHPPDLHEYLKSARLLKAMLEQAENLEGITAEVSEGRPEHDSVLAHADLVLTLSDGPDGPNGRAAPYMTEEALGDVQRHVDRGGGFMTYHFSTFAPDSLADLVLDWAGGYFDWQNASGEREWYSDIAFADTTVVNLAPGHPIMQGVPASFRLHDEFYYQMRFRESDPRLQPLLAVPSLGSALPLGNTVAWAVERPNGGRGVGTTLGHFMRNWEDPVYRRFMLNAVVWAAGADVPSGGVDAPYLTDRQVTRRLFGAHEKLLIITGHHHPGHDWAATTSVLKSAIGADSLLHVDVTTSIGDLAEIRLDDYGALVLNYCNWEAPEPIGESAREALLTYVDEGGGLMVIHFANGAFHHSLPGAGASDWPAYRRLVRRVWDHTSDSAHDAYGTFTVNIANPDHPITEGMDSFETTDELYYRQKGDLPVDVLLTARSKDTGEDEPLAFVYREGKGRVFQILLGHDAASLDHPAMRKLLRRGGRWVTGL